MKTTEYQKILRNDLEKILASQDKTVFKNSTYDAKKILNYLNEKQILEIMEKHNNSFLMLLEMIFSDYEYDVNEDVYKMIFKSEYINVASVSRQKNLIIAIKKLGLAQKIEGFEKFEDEFYQLEMKAKNSNSLIEDLNCSDIFSFSNSALILSTDNPKKILKEVEELFMSEISKLLSPSSNSLGGIVYDFDLNVKTSNLESGYIPLLNQLALLKEIPKDFICHVIEKAISYFTKFAIENPRSLSDRSYVLRNILFLLYSDDESFQEIKNSIDKDYLTECLVILISNEDYLDETFVNYYYEVNKIFEEKGMKFSPKFSILKNKKDLKINSNFWSSLFDKNNVSLLKYLVNNEREALLEIYIPYFLERVPFLLKDLDIDNENVIKGKKPYYTILDTFYENNFDYMSRYMYQIYAMEKLLQDNDLKEDFKQEALEKINKTHELVFFGLFNHLAFDFFEKMFAYYEETYGEIKTVDQIRKGEVVQQLRIIAEKLTDLTAYRKERSLMKKEVEEKLQYFMNKPLSLGFWTVHVLEDMFENVGMNLQDVLENEEYSKQSRDQYFILQLINRLNSKTNINLSSLKEQKKFKINFDFNLCKFIIENKLWQESDYYGAPIDRVLDLGHLEFIEVYVILKDITPYNQRKEVDRFIDYLSNNLNDDDKPKDVLKNHPEYNIEAYKKALKSYSLI